MDFTVWITFVTASMVLLIIPGPTILLVLSYAISQGRRTALATALGVAVGDLIAMTASLAGLGAPGICSRRLIPTGFRISAQGFRTLSRRVPPL